MQSSRATCDAGGVVVSVFVPLNLSEANYRMLVAIATKRGVNVPTLIEKHLDAGLTGAPSSEVHAPVSKNLTKRQVDTIIRLHGEGMNDAEIAEVLAIPSNTVLSRRRRLKLPANAPRGWPKGKRRRPAVEEQAVPS
jgi:DNA-binding NarL/FixJ family response regulator